MAGRQHSVLIVEDHDHTARGLVDRVRNNPLLKVCGLATTLETGLALLQQHRPRILLTDLGLPDGSGLDLIDAAIQADWQCDPLVISVFGDEKRVTAAIRHGARGYVLKNSGDDDIARRILDVIDGGNPISPKIARHFLALAAKAPATGETESGVETLTARELQVLTLLARGFKRAEIADNLSISIGTVGNHIHSIYRKLNVGSNIEAVAKASKTGMM